MDSSHQLPILTGGAELGQAPHEQAIDPVCGMTVDKRAAKFTLHHQTIGLLLLLPFVPRQVRRRSGAVSQSRWCTGG